MGVVVAILGRFSAFCPGTARGTDHTHFLNNHLRLFAGEQFYAFILSLYTLGRLNVKTLISSRIIRSLSFRNLKPVDHLLLFYFLLFDLMRSGEFIPCGV